MKVPMFTVRIWDLPTRLFHWALAACVLGLLITGNLGGDAMILHFRLGYMVLSLLLFRGAWGLLGGYWSRWSQLPLHPVKVWTYFQGHPSLQHLAGHNPLGSWSILFMLFFLALQVCTGLVSDDEIAYSGPLSSLVSGNIVSIATSWHKHWGKLILILLVLTHVLALIWYRWHKKQSLVPAMWHGNKNLPTPVPASSDSWHSRLLAFALFGLSLWVVFTVVSMGA